MAHPNSINYLKRLLKENDIDSNKYDIHPEMPQRLCSQMIDRLLAGEEPEVETWRQPEGEKTGAGYTVESFEKEISLIQDKWLQGFVRTMLSTYVPKYFFEIPASSTGKYHPNYCLGNGGLVRHTKAAVQISKDLLENPLYQKIYPQSSRDRIYAALILHDTAKSGLTHSKYTKHDHPMLVAKLLPSDVYDSYTEDQKKLVDCVFELVGCHMGPWNTSNYDPAVLPVPESPEELFVHFSDYLASRKKIEVVVE